MSSSRKHTLHFAWLLIALIATAAAAIVWYLVVPNAPPANAVLIQAPSRQGASGQNTRTSQNGRAGTSLTPTATTGEPLAVDVSGAVAKPGVYKLAAGARIIDAIQLAGGAVADADIEAVNLAARLADGDHIIVPHKVQGGASSGSRPAEVPAIAHPTRSPSAKHASATPSVTVNINTATQAQLETLPNIGPSLAARIIVYRDQHGPFGTTDGLKNVAGIKEALYAKIKAYVVAEP
ncbi:MAG: ComEA family DNA-binding protein [Chloroflexota bacterium]|nr:ComEA family DNA-binding protein [Chloroflexota bacterium]